MGVLFDTGNGKQEVKVFIHRPLGIQFSSTMPVVVKRLQQGSQARQLGVQVGWEVKAINGTPLAKSSVCQAFATLTEPTVAFRRCMPVRDRPLDKQSVAKLSTKLKEIKKTEVVAALKQYGFVAQTSKLWGSTGPLPELHLDMVGSSREISTSKRHTWYSMFCKVITGEGFSTRCWVVERRLAHIRALLHDPVKQELGEDYVQYFGKARFAHHGKPPGTTARVESWLAALSKAIHYRSLSPALVASILRFLEAPVLDEDAGRAMSEGEIVPSNVFIAKALNYLR